MSPGTPDDAAAGCQRTIAHDKMHSARLEPVQTSHAAGRSFCSSSFFVASTRAFRMTAHACSEARTTTATTTARKAYSSQTNMCLRVRIAGVNERW